MHIQDILTIYDYNYWANQRILDTCAKISPKDYVAKTTHSYGSLRGTLVHTLDTEWGWRQTCQGTTPSPDLTEKDLPTLDALRTRWKDEEATMRAYLGTLSDDDLGNVIRYKTPAGVQRERILWHCLIHVVNHGTQHRSEAAAMLTDFGQSPGDIDLTVFLNEQQGK